MSCEEARFGALFLLVCTAVALSAIGRQSKTTTRSFDFVARDSAQDAGAGEFTIDGWGIED
jgi:hypothetical protein